MTAGSGVLRALAAAAVLSAVVALPVATADPEPASDVDRVFFDQLEQQGFHPDYGRQVCGSIKCESLGELLIAEGRAICAGLGGGSAPLVPIAVIEYLDIAPDRAAAFIDASRAAYCPQAPDPYAPQR